MKRRAILGGAALGAGILACPAWLARAFAQEADTGLAALSEAYRRAQRGGRPLLVIVIPAQHEARWERATAFGELLNHGADDVLADLALAELACTRMETLRTLVPQAPAGEPLMVLVEPDRVPAAARAIDAELPRIPEYWVGSEEMTWEERERRDQAVIDQRIALLSRLIHGAIAPDAAAIARRAALARARVSAEQRGRVELAMDAGDVPTSVAALAPALLAERAASAPALRDVLRDLAIERWRRGRVPGSRWAIGGGCGVEVELTEAEQRERDAAGRAQMMVACGMGHVPERSARFLDWYLEP